MAASLLLIFLHYTQTMFSLVQYKDGDGVKVMIQNHHGDWTKDLNPLLCIGSREYLTSGLKLMVL